MAHREGHRIALQIHGNPTLTIADARAPLERKAAGVLAWLALRGPAPREKLSRSFWPQSGAESARNNLRQLVFKLKKLAGRAVVVGQEELALAPAVELLAAGAQPLLDGLDYSDCPDFAEWLAAFREASRSNDFQNRLQAFDEAEQRGDLQAARALARELVEADPLSDAAQQRWIRALYLGGDAAQALEAARQFEHRLRDELGMAPNEGTQRLVENVRAHAVPASLRAGAGSMPVTLLRPPRLVGRDAQLTHIAQIRESHRVPLVIGEAGLGKSRLVAEASLPGDWIVGARPSDLGVPYATLTRLVRQGLERTPAAFESLPPVQRSRVEAFLPERGGTGVSRDGQRLEERVAAVAQLLRAAQALGLGTVWLDDLHFADPASLDALPLLIDDPAAGSVSFGLARRPAEGGAGLAEWLDRWCAEGRVEPVHVLPLDAGQIGELVQSLAVPELDDPALPEALLRTTGGNPLFILETLKHRWAGGATARPGDLPRAPTVLSLIAQRLARLSAPALGLARVAALAGPDFSIDLAVHVLQRPALDLADAWQELQVAQVLRDEAFAHDLIFEATLAEVPQAIQRHTRGAIAAYLEPRDGEPLRLAEHWMAAGDPGRAAPHFEAAARKAERAVRYAEARGAMARAADTYEQAGRHAESLQAWVALADWMKEHGDARDAAEMLLGLERQQALADDRLLVAAEYLAALSWLDRSPEAAVYGEALLGDEAMMAEASEASRAAFHCKMSNLYRVMGRPAQALEHLEPAAGEYAEHPDAQLRGWYHSDVGACLRDLGRFREARPSILRALECARQTGRHRMVAGVLQSLANLEHQSGHLLRPLEVAEDAVKLMSEADDDTPFGCLLKIQVGRDHVQLGRLSRAVELLEPLQRRVDLPADWRALASAWLARAWAYLGHADRAGRLLATLDTLPQREITRRVRLEAAFDLTLLCGGDAAQVLDSETFPGHRAASLRGRALRAWCRPGIEPEDALQGLRQQAEQDEADGLVLLADLALAGLGAETGRAALAAGAGERALRALGRITAPGIYRASLWLSLHDTLHRLAPELAAHAARAGAEWVRNVGAFQVAASARAAFQSGNPVNRRLLQISPADAAMTPQWHPNSASIAPQ